MDDLQSISELREKCKAYGLEDHEMLYRFTLAEIAREYNGAGPDSWLPEARDLLTALMTLFKPVVMIHDMQFAQSDGTDDGFEHTVCVWKHNTRIILDAEYPLFTWKMLSREYRAKRTYWFGVMLAANKAISTTAARKAWLEAYEKRKALS